MTLVNINNYRGFLGKYMLCDLSLATNNNNQTNKTQRKLHLMFRGISESFMKIMTSHASLTLNLACVPLNFLFFLPFSLSFSPRTVCYSSIKKLYISRCSCLLRLHLNKYNTNISSAIFLQKICYEYFFCLFLEKTFISFIFRCYFHVFFPPSLLQSNSSSFSFCCSCCCLFVCYN